MTTSDYKDATGLSLKRKLMPEELKRKIVYIGILKFVPRTLIFIYVVGNLFYLLACGSLMPYWWVLLILIGLTYTLKDIYLEGYEVINIVELDSGKYPSWIINHVSYGIDGYAKIKRRIIYEIL